MLRHHFAHPLNACTACGHDFAGLTYFEQHRVGRYEPLERRCLDEDEMQAAGLSQNADGRWTDVAKAEQARAAFRRPLAA